MGLKLLDEETTERATGGYQINGHGAPKAELDVGGVELMKRVDFWLLFVSMAIEDGAAVFFANSLSSMRGSLAAVGSADHLPEVSMLVIYFAISNAVGRFTWGVVSDRYRTKRAAVLLCTMIGMFGGE